MTRKTTYSASLTKDVPVPENETERLKALHDYGVLDTPEEAAFDDLARLASRIFETPIALICLVDEKRQWFKSRVGLDFRETPRNFSFCAHAILQRDVLVVPDATLDPRFVDNPLVTKGPALRFYAGVPIITPTGHAVGALCVMDIKPREFTPSQTETLRILTHQALTQLELRLKLSELNRTLTEHRRSEDALRQAEEKYRGIFENVVEGIFQTTPSGEYISVNPMLAEIYGYESPTDLMASIRDIEHQIYVDPSRRDEFIHLMQERQIVTKFESQVYRKDRSVIWISENARAVKDKNGHLLYYEGTVEDITERRQTEEALRNSEVVYHSLVENLPQNIFRKDLEGRFTFANRRFCATLKKPLDKVLGKTDFDFFPKDLAEKYHQDDLRVVSTLKIFEAIEAHQTPDRGKIYVEVIKAPLYDHSGKVVGVQGIFWDVTERKKIEEDLAYERDLLNALLENVPDGIYFKDIQSRFIKCSRALANRFGLKTPKDAVGKSDFEFFASEHALPAFDDEKRIVATGEPLIAKTEKEIWPDGRQTWALTTKMPLRNKEGEIIGTFGVSKDITELKQAEEELQEARDAALESSRLKAEFLANVSHEIRTPMNAIIGLCGLLMDGELTTDQRDLAQTVRDSAETLLAIINDILDFSKIEAGKLTFESIDFDLREVVEGTVDVLAERAFSKGLELASWVHQDLPILVQGDPGRLRQVLLNLIGNAVKFTDRGEVIVEVTKEEETSLEVQLRFTVRDTGIGIAEKALPCLFQAFTQADGSMTRRYGGTGLGLAIVKQLVELMHGQVHVQSTPGAGSSFWFTARFQKQRPSEQRPGDADKETLPDNLHLLIVDDNPTTRTILRQQLAGARIASDMAADAAQALELLKSKISAGEPHDAILIDLQMPETDGLALSRQIKEDPALSQTRLILLTPIGYRLDAEELQSTGIEACLTKPIKQSRLLDTLTNVMGPRTGNAAGSTADRVNTDLLHHHPAFPKEVRVLLAEDNIVNQRMALRQLRQLGYSADAVANGLEVLKALDIVPYDIILMDCQMPDMDGYKTTQEIRRREKEAAKVDSAQPHYIVALTANALSSDRQRCLKVGMDDYISKPVRMAELEQVLYRALRHLNRGVPAGAGAKTRLSLDRGILADLRQLKSPDETDPVVELIELFCRDAASRIEKMEESLQQKDFPALVQLAHALKGSASNLGAPTLAGICSRLEKKSEVGSLPDATRLVHEIKSEYLLVYDALRAETKSIQTVGTELS